MLRKKSPKIFGFRIPSSWSDANGQGNHHGRKKKMLKKTSWLVATALTIGFGGAVQAAWQPTKPVEFIVTSSPGGGTDNFARVVQSIIAKHKLLDQPVVVTNKGGGSGAEGFIYA